MKLTVTCRVCGEIITIVEKECIHKEDINEYQANCSCDADGQANIQVEVIK
jgi:hypothetical protein